MAVRRLDIGSDPAASADNGGRDGVAFANEVKGSVCAPTFGGCRVRRRRISSRIPTAHDRPSAAVKATLSSMETRLLSEHSQTAGANARHSHLQMRTSSQRDEEASVAGNSTDAGRSVTSKVTAILMVFADDGVHTLTEIAASAHLPTSTAHRLASELVAWRLLERTEERHYRIGLPLRIIASEYSESEVCSTTQTVMRALPMLDDLSRATRSEVRLGVLRGSQVLTLRPHTQSVLRTRARCGAPAWPLTGACGGRGQSTACLLPTIRHQPCHRGRVARVHPPYHHLAGRPAPESFGHQADADRDVAQRIRVRQSGHRDADLLRGRPRRRRHRTRRPRSEHRIEACRRRAIRCVSQSLAPTGH